MILSDNSVNVSANPPPRAMHFFVFFDHRSNKNNSNPILILFLVVLVIVIYNIYKNYIVFHEAMEMECER